MTSCLDRISSSFQLIQLEERAKPDPCDDNKWLNKFNDLIKEDLSTFTECHHRILLRLNKKDDILLINALQRAKVILSDSDILFDKDLVYQRIDTIISIAQDLLKHEWEVVKAGEKPY